MNDVTRRDAIKQAAAAVATAVTSVGMGVQAAPAVGKWDVVCGQCGSVCCANCTANGDINRCDKTRFTTCSVCHHASRRHDKRPRG
jgi:hypothetical protein